MYELGEISDFGRPFEWLNELDFHALDGLRAIVGPVSPLTMMLPSHEGTLDSEAANMDNVDIV